MLTVDWSGHKTVLVEVPGSGASRSNEVEMNGMGEGDYGRLIDDDEVSLSLAHVSAPGRNLTHRTRSTSRTEVTSTNRDTAVNTSTKSHLLSRPSP